MERNSFFFNQAQLVSFNCKHEDILGSLEPYKNKVMSGFNMNIYTSSNGKKIYVFL